MKELKFRVWEERENAYDTWSYILDSNGNLFRNVYGALIGCDKEDYIVEQYTGLKDKNGKEIYEGDIVEAPIYGVWTTGNSDAIFGDKIWKLLVIWSDADCGFLFKVIGSKNQPNRVYDILDQRLGAFVVIGNIHENADLLEKKE